MTVEESIEPDEIIWENLAYTGDEQYFRKILMQIISIIFLVLTNGKNQICVIEFKFVLAACRKKEYF